jgi:hypothetical protein
MPEAEGGPYERSEELSSSESGAFDDEPKSADVPQANDDALEKPGTMTQDLARSPGTPEALTLIHLISIPVTNTSVNSARSAGPALFAGGWTIEQLWLFWLAPLAGAILGALDKVAAGGIVESPDSAATASDRAEVWRG